jgi:hypothetical protein
VLQGWGGGAAAPAGGGGGGRAGAGAGVRGDEGWCLLQRRGGGCKAACLSNSRFQQHRTQANCHH